MVSKQIAVAAKAESTDVEHFTPGRSHGVIARIAARFGVDSEKMLETLKQTAFRQVGKNGAAALVVTNEQMMMLLVIADQYHLNPFTREIYAFPSENGIVAIVSVDGWIRIINEHPQLDSIEFEMAEPGTDDPWISCIISRKDRSRPTKITEFLSECSRDTKPWNSHPRRMLRHKALIQCARVAFGFAGIFDPDEAERVVATIEAGTVTPRNMKPATKEPQRVGSAPLPVPSITLDQVTVLVDKCKAEGIDDSLVCAHFEIGELDQLLSTQYQDALKAIETISAGEK